MSQGLNRRVAAGLYVAQEARRAGKLRADDHRFATVPASERFAPATDPRCAPQGSLLELRRYELILPMPLSVNGAWRSPQAKEIAAGMAPSTKFLTAEHRQYRSATIANVRRVMRTDPPLAGRLELRVSLHFANARRCDIDNRIKPLQDALTHAQAYADDSQIDRLVVERILTSGAEHCAVTLLEISA